MKRIMTLCILAVSMLIAAAPMTVCAQDTPLTFTVDQSAPAGAAFTYLLKSLDGDNPMPAGAAENGYLFAITGTANARIGPLNYGRPGIFRYMLFQVIQAEKPGWSYDRRVYAIEVYVDAALNAALVAINVDGTKADDIHFENRGPLPSETGSITDPSNPGGDGPTGPTGNGDGPKTGDDTRTVFYYILLGVSGAAAIAATVYLLAYGKREKRKKRD